MRYEVEWEGHKIAWELSILKKRAYLFGSEKLYVDDEFLADGPKKLAMSETVRGEFRHGSRDVPVELYLRAGFFGVLTRLKIDGELVKRKYIPVWRIKNWLLSLLASFLLWMIIAIAAMFIVNPNIVCNNFPNKIVLRSRELKTENLSGKIYFADTLGKLMTYTPSTGDIETLLVTDSMAIRDVSPDGKSVILVCPRGFKRHNYPLRKVYWLTLDDGRMRLISERKMEFAYANFTPDGKKIYFVVNDTFPSQTVVADTFGNLTLIKENTGYPANSTGSRFFCHRNYGHPWKIFDLNSGQTTVLDTTIFPKRSVPYWWSDDTVLSRAYRQKKNLAFFVDLESERIDTVDYPGFNFRVFPFPKLIIINKSIGGFRLIPPSFIDRIFVYKKDSLLWESWNHRIGSVVAISPDPSVLCYIVSSKKLSEYKFFYCLIGHEGARKTIPIDGYVLDWLKE